MALSPIGGMPIIPIGAANRQGNTSLAALGNTTLDATNEACHMTGYVWWADGGTHTVDTSGSSSLQWRTGTVTFANGATTVKVGLADVDAAAGPPARAVNASDVVTLDVSASFTGGGGGITTAAWQTSVPTAGSKTIATWDEVAFVVQMTARGGADSVLVSAAPVIAVSSKPGVTDFVGGSYATANRLPNAVIVASDGTLGFFFGGHVASVGSTNQAWNNTSGTKEYGNILRVGAPLRAYGIMVGNTFGGDCDLILYSDPLGTPVAERTRSVDLNTVNASTVQSNGFFPFATTYDLVVGTDYAVIAKPTSATNVTMGYKTFNASAHQSAEVLGTTCYAVNRDTGAFAAQNSSKDRFTIGLLVGASDDGAGGAAGGLIRHPGRNGGLAA
jgi:hypothetical protein